MPASMTVARAPVIFIERSEAILTYVEDTQGDFITTMQMTGFVGASTAQEVSITNIRDLGPLVRVPEFATFAT